MQSPEIKKKKGISPIWILPIIALLVGGWLLYRGVQNAGIDVIVHFKTGEGITVGKTKVMYKGIPVGVVRDMDVDKNLKGVALTIEMDKKTRKGLVEDTKFWLVKPKVSAGRISGLSTLLSGSYIGVQRGRSHKECREFIGLEEEPGKSLDVPGLHFSLKADALGSIQKGSNIYYKNIVVGSVQNFRLLDGTGVEIDAFVEPQYADFIRTSTRFWNSSGVVVKGGISGFKVRMESVASLVYGGISFYTPKEKMAAPRAQNGEEFSLYEDFEAAEYGIKITLRLPSAMGLAAGVSKVMYRGFEVGIVSDFKFNNDEKRSVTASVVFNPEAEFALRENTKFWVVQPKLSVNRVENLETLIKGTYLTFNPGDGDYCEHFVTIEQPMAEEILRPGTHYRLVTDNSRSLSVGAPVLFKKMQVGEVTGYDLAEGGDKVEADIFIYEKYNYLVRPDSVFWKTGGVKLEASMEKGVKVDIGTITSLISGGIIFANGELDGKEIKPAKGNTLFNLYETFHDATEAVPSLKPDGIVVSVRAQSSKAFSVGSPVLFKHIEAGEIVGVRLADDEQDIILDVFIAQKYAHLLKKTSRFYNISGITVEGGIGNFKIRTGSAKSILAGGIAFFTPKKGEAADENTSFVLYDGYQDALDVDKTKIFIRFSKPEGLKEGMEIKYQGIKVGEVCKVKIDMAKDFVIAEALIDQEAEKLFLTDSLVWLVSAEFGLSGVSNLDTIIKGPYIAVLPGSAERCRNLVACNSPPSLRDKVKGGLSVVLRTPTLGSLKQNSPVYYRQVRVGRVVGYDLADSAQEVMIYVNIDEAYQNLIHENTVFWNASGIDVDAGIFSGLQIYTESLESIVAGGIALATPEGEAMGAQVENDHCFVLHDKLDEDWLAWKPSIRLTNR